MSRIFLKIRLLTVPIGMMTDSVNILAASRQLLLKPITSSVIDADDGARADHIVGYIVSNRHEFKRYLKNFR